MASTLSPLPYPPHLYVRGLKYSLRGRILLMALGEIRSQSVALFVLIFIIASVTSKECLFSPYGQKRFRSMSESSGLTSHLNYFIQYDQHLRKMTPGFKPFKLVKKVVQSLCHLFLVPYDTSIVLQYNAPVQPILA